jgi:CelD/BcsL family acetyltransferase involved in cellulose biosynthesis
MRVEVVTTRSAFAALESEWNVLAAAQPSPLLGHAWFAACIDAWAADRELAVFCARLGGRLCAVAPLVVERTGAWKTLRMLGWQTMEPEAFLYEDEAALEQICAAVVRARRPVILGRLGADSPELRLLQAGAGGRGSVVVRASSSQTYSTVLAAGAEATEASMASKKRSEMRRLKTQLQKQGEVTFEVLSPDEAQAAKALEELCRVEAASWKAQAGTAMALDGRLRRFMDAYAAAAARAGMLRLSFLRVDSTPVSVQLDIECGGRLWGLKMGSDEAWSKFAPGILSTHELIRWAADRGLATCEHLGSAEAWQRRWPFQLKEQSTFRFYPWRLGGALSFTADAASFAARRAGERLARRKDGARA